MIISDDSQSVTQQFTVVVSPVNDAPTVNAVETQYLLAGSSRSVSITGIGAGASNESQTLSVNATSSNPLITASVNYTSPGASAQLTLTVGEIVFEEATIVVSVSDGGLTTSRHFHVSAGKKKASFAAVEMASAAGPISLWLANLRGKDTWRDLIVANYIAGSITYRLCDDLGGFTLPKTIVLGGNPSSVFAGDVNGDKFQDIMVGDYAANTVVVLRNLKAGNFGAPGLNFKSIPLPRGGRARSSFTHVAVRHREGSSDRSTETSVIPN